MTIKLIVGKNFINILYIPNQKKCCCLKLHLNWEDLYTILTQINGVVYLIQKHARARIKVVSSRPSSFLCWIERRKLEWSISLKNFWDKQSFKCVLLRCLLTGREECHRSARMGSVWVNIQVKRPVVIT